MFENMKMGWALGRQVRKLVFGDKTLLVYPIISAVAVFIEAVLIFLSFLFVPAIAAIWLVAALFVFYLVATFTSTYILAAMLLAFRAYANKKPISMGEAFGQTRQYAMLIFEWALFYAIVLMIIRIIESRFRGIGQLVVGAVASIALAIATLFAIPVIIDNKVGPISAVRIGATFFVKNFGKTAGGLIYSDLYNLMFVLLGILIMVIGFFAGFAIGSLAAGAVIAVIGFIVLVFGVLMNFLTANAFKFILYEYLNGRSLPAGIDKSLLDRSIAARNRTKQPGQG